MSRYFSLDIEISQPRPQDDVGRTSIREAVRSLANLGMLETLVGFDSNGMPRRLREADPESGGGEAERRRQERDGADDALVEG